MKLSELKNEILSESEVKEVYDKLTPEYEAIKAVLNARKKMKLTQKELSELTGIDRADISKLENGNTNPTLGLLLRIADGLNMQLHIEFKPKKIK